MQFCCYYCKCFRNTEQERWLSKTGGRWKTAALSLWCELKTTECIHVCKATIRDIFLIGSSAGTWPRSHSHFFCTDHWMGERLREFWPQGQACSCSIMLGPGWICARFEQMLTSCYLTMGKALSSSLFLTSFCYSKWHLQPWSSKFQTLQGVSEGQCEAETSKFSTWGDTGSLGFGDAKESWWALTLGPCSGIWRAG